MPDRGEGRDGEDELEGGGSKQKRFHDPLIFIPAEVYLRTRVVYDQHYGTETRFHSRLLVESTEYIDVERI